MSRGLKFTVIIIGIVVLFFGLRITDTYIYPFKKASPNFSDVEAAFAKLQFPSEWQEIDSSENRGLHGRDCKPIDNSGCFHKSKTFRVSDSTDNNNVVDVLKTAGCTGAVTDDISYGGDQKPSTSFECSTGGGITYVASLSGPKSEVYVGANTY